GMNTDDMNPTQSAGTGGDLPTVLLDQIEWHVREQLRPRLEGLTDEEYFFDPSGTGRAWTVHPRTPAGEEPPTSLQGGAGEMVIDFEGPEPSPAPLTTIAWRLGHLIVGVLAMRSHSHHGGPPADYMSWDYAASAAEALAQFDAEYDRWIAGVRTWDADDLQAAVGEAEGAWAAHSRATLVAHLNRELIHHLAEIALLRDPWAHRGCGSDTVTRGARRPARLRGLRGRGETAAPGGCAAGRQSRGHEGLQCEHRSAHGAGVRLDLGDGHRDLGAQIAGPGGVLGLHHLAHQHGSRLQCRAREHHRTDPERARGGPHRTGHRRQRGGEHLAST